MGILDTYDLEKHAAEMGGLSDDELVSLLKNEDPRAWSYVYLQVITVVKKFQLRGSGVTFGKIMRDRNVDAGEIWAKLYEYMVGRGKLEVFYRQRSEKPHSLIVWMRFYAIKFIMEYVDPHKNPLTLSDEVIENVSIIDETNTREAKETLRLSFAELWRQNPMRAYVFLLKSQGYPSAEIRNRLGLASANYVDQCSFRAKTDLRGLVMRYSGDGK